MAYDENQTFLPDSFTALYRDQRQRLTESKETILGYYELCEDMAQMLIEHCRAAHLGAGINEQQILERCHAGLVAPGSAFTAPQAEWVIRRTAELLEWQHWVPEFQATSRQG